MHADTPISVVERVARGAKGRKSRERERERENERLRDTEVTPH